MTTPPDARRDRILAFLRAHPGTRTAQEIADDLSEHFDEPIARSTVCDEAQRLVVRGDVERDGAARFRIATGKARKRLPVVGYMARGWGDRDDTCGRYDKCLTAAANDGAPMAYCPQPCPHHEPTPPVRATDYSRNLDAPDLTAYA